MSGPILYVDESEILPGALPRLRRALADLVRTLREQEPRLLAYHVHVDEPQQRMTVWHVHRDAESLDHHVEVVAPHLAPFRELVRLRRIDVYGTPTAHARARLAAKAELLGGSGVRIHPFLAGWSAWARDADA